jgi:hypothetical protein
MLEQYLKQASATSLLVISVSLFGTGILFDAIENFGGQTA